MINPNEQCKTGCPLCLECTSNRGYFDCAKRLIRFIEERFIPTDWDAKNILRYRLTEWSKSHDNRLSKDEIAQLAEELDMYNEKSKP